MEMGMASIQKNMMAADMSPIPYCLIEMTSIHKFRVPQIEAACVYGLMFTWAPEQ
jgi:hypothetical protein